MKKGLPLSERRPLSSPLFAAAVLVLLIVLAYWPGLSGSYLFDDFPVIYKNPQIQMEALDWPSIRRALGGFNHGEYGRPLASLSFAFNYLIGGGDPWGYKLAGLLIHVLNALLVGRLVYVLVAHERGRGKSGPAGWVAIAAAAIWVLHPLQVSSVLYIVQRMETLATTFILVSLLFYMEGRQRQLRGVRAGWVFIALAAFAAVIGMLSKEVAALSGLYALCLELTLLRFAAAASIDRRILKAAYSIMLLVIAVATIYLCVKYGSAEAYQGRWYVMHERILTQLRVLPLYLGQMFLPVPGNMHFYYDDVVASRSLFDPISTFFGGLLLLGLLALAVWSRRRWPLVSLGVTWFFAAHLLSSGPVNLELVFEHRNYFALLGVVIATGAILTELWQGWDRRLLVFLSLASILGLAGLTALRSATWGNPLLLATEFAQENPRSARAATDLAEQYMLLSGMRANSPFYAMAVSEFERAAALPMASPLPESALLMLASTAGQPVDQAWWDSLRNKISHNPVGPQERLAVESLLIQFYGGVVVDVNQLDEVINILFARSAPDSAGFSQYADFLLRANLDNHRAVDLYIKSYEATGQNREYFCRMRSDVARFAMPDVSRQLDARAVRVAASCAAD